LTAERLVSSCLQRIRKLEPRIHAWAYLDPEHALARARSLDKSKPRGLLTGVPVGVKDVIDTADLPTAYGSPIYKGHRPTADADCVVKVRQANGVVMGKTVTTEFASWTPGPTTNPHNAKHTPGGSSSGSAAAVAAGMIPLAFGTQTGGSVIRPASFCGIVGYKATRLSLPVAGIKPLCAALDTLGAFAREVGDLLLLHAALAGVPDDQPGIPRHARIGICRGPSWPLAKAESIAALERAEARLRAARAEVDVVELPPVFDAVLEAHEVLMTRGIAHAYDLEWQQSRDRLSPKFVETVSKGLNYTNFEVDEARRIAQVSVEAMDRILRDYDALLTPAATGEAPKGLDSTGDPAFNRMWTLLETPAVSLPTATGPKGLPVGVQFIGARGTDRQLLALCDWAFDAIRGRTPKSDFALLPSKPSLASKTKMSTPPKTERREPAMTTSHLPPTSAVALASSRAGLNLPSAYHEAFEEADKVLRQMAQAVPRDLDYADEMAMTFRPLVKD
jgi:amidase